jgi:hypothetical protein
MVAYAVLRLNPARPMQAPVRKCVRGSIFLLRACHTAAARRLSYNDELVKKHEVKKHEVKKHEVKKDEVVKQEGRPRYEQREQQDKQVEERAMGDRFRKMVLSRGNTQDLKKMYEAWLGAEPGIEPMLKFRGLTGNQAK